MNRVSLSLVLPAYNEQAGLRQAIAEADEALARICADYEILVVDDGSKDDTAAIAQDESQRRPHVRLLRHPVNRGYGAALRTGFEAACFDLVAFTDADCQFHLDDLTLLLPHTQSVPVVVGHRLDRKDPWRRRFLSRGYNLLARTLLGTTVRDIDCALKVFRREALAHILPTTPGFFVNTEMLTRARQHGLEVVEVGVRHRPRLRGQSTVSLRDVPRTLGSLLPFWWSEVMFAKGVAGPTVREGVSRSVDTTPSLTVGPANALPNGRVCDRLVSITAFVLLLLVASLLFFVRLRAPLLEPQEARYAEIPRQMLLHDRFVVPLLHGQDYLDKPPLLYWAVMTSYRIFGVHDWAARLVPGLAGVLTVLLSFLWGRRTLGVRAGLCGALLLCLTPEFVYRGRMLTFDVLLMLWVTASLAAGHMALLSGYLRWRWWLVSAVACGLGLVTKGPVALALVVVPLFALVWLDRRLARVEWRGWSAFVGVATLVAAPWYVAVMAARPDFVHSFFWTHNVVRFVAPFDHVKPIWFYLPGLALGLLPWLLLLPVLLGLLGNRSARMARRRPAALGFALLTFGWMLLFFSLAGCKRPTYLLPALPPLALALGWVIAVRLPRWRLLLAHGSRLAAATAGTALIAGISLSLVAALLGMIAAPTGFLLAGVGLAALAVLMLASRRVSWAVAALVMFAVLFVGVRELLPAYNDQFALRGQLRRQADLVKLTRRPVVRYPMRYDSVDFYLRGVQVRVFGYGQKRELIAHLKANPDTLVLIKSGDVYRDVERELPAEILLHRTTQRGAAPWGE